MSVVVKRMVPGSLASTGATTLYTVPANTKTVIKAATLANATTTPAKASVYLVPSAGSAGQTNQVITAVNIGAGLTYNCPEAVNQVMEAGGTLQVSSDTVSAIAVVVSGVEIA